MMERAIVIGAGLAGCEAAWQLAQRGVPVTLHEMKPHAFTPAHHSAACPAAFNKRAPTSPARASAGASRCAAPWTRRG